MNMDRRQFLGSLSLGGLGLMSLPNAWAEDSNTTPVLFPVPTDTGIGGRVVVVGGGMSGAAVAKYLRLWGGTGVNVTLVEASPSYTSNIMSNTVLTGQRTLASLNYTYATLSGHYGVNRVTAKVSGIDRAQKLVTLEGGGTIGYDRLVLAPGLDFDLLPGMTSLAEYETLVPHAWKAGPQTQLLRNQLVAMPAGQNVVLTIPKAPYRCPPGPYERVCVIADWLKRNKAGSRIIVLDANADIIVEKENFSHAFTTLYAGVVDYRPGCTVTQVNSAQRWVTYNQVVNGNPVVTNGQIQAAVLNPIPPQRAPQLLKDAGLLSADSSKPFAPVDVLTYQSVADPLIHVIGDASLTTQPKAGHIGNQQGKTCADAVLRLLSGRPMNTQVVTNSACYTPITATTATWLSAMYQYDPTTRTMVILPQHNNGKAIAAAEATSDNYQDMQRWFTTLMGETFS
ncbi:MAG: NAD(P)/FAD-dependent oxidoreductase [Betaproteobacteria bacterium]|nr:NAD(P)/FAD-dependent oxidoreductase [Betaproteobacteria bacterium]